MIAARSRLKGTELDFYPLAALSKAGLPDTSGLPMTVKVLLEGLLRLSEAGATDEQNVKSLAAWPKPPPNDSELPFLPARVGDVNVGFAALILNVVAAALVSLATQPAPVAAASSPN